MNLDTCKMNVAEENKARFEKAAQKWHLLIMTIGWPALCELYVERRPPFQDVKPLAGKRRAKLRQAKIILLANVIDDLKANGLEVTE